MKRYYQNASMVVQLINGRKVNVFNHNEGTLQRETRNEILSYSSINVLPVKLFDAEEFYSICPLIDWSNDIEPLIIKISAGKLVSFTLSLLFEKRIVTTVLENETCCDETISSKIDIHIILQKSENYIPLKKTLYFAHILNPESIQQLIENEVDQINNTYSSYSVHAVDSLKADIILPSGTGGIFIHEALGHCLEADIYFKKSNIIHGRIGKEITKNKEIRITDSCENTDILKYGISDDGTRPTSISLVEDGCIANIMTDNFFSSVYGVKDTGNGRSADIFNLPIPRMRNTFLHNGTVDVSDIICSSNYGLIPLGIQGGNVTVETGVFVFNVSHALIVEHGKITGISQPFLFSGNIITALDSIKLIGNDLSFQRAVCGKAGQLIDVVYGTPTILISQR